MLKIKYLFIYFKFIFIIYFCSRKIDSFFLITMNELTEKFENLEVEGECENASSSYSEYPLRLPAFNRSQNKIPSQLELKLERPAAITDEMICWLRKNGIKGCWRCLRPNNFIKDCPREKLFPVYYNCGASYVTVVDCPNCKEDYKKFGPFTKRFLTNKQK